MRQLVLVTRVKIKRVARQSLIKSLQQAVVLLRNSGLLLERTFPSLLSPVEVVDTSHLDKGKLVRSHHFLVKIGIRKSFTPQELWLKFNMRGNSFSVSNDKICWVCISGKSFKT